MKRGIVILALIVSPLLFWFWFMPSGRQWRLQRTSKADLYILALTKPDAAVYTALTDKLIAEGHFEEAAGTFALWATALPEDPLPRQKRGEMLLRANQFAEAIPLLESAATKSKQAQTIALLAYAYYLMGDRIKAEEQVARALALKAHHQGASAVKALLYADRHQFSSAKEALGNGDTSEPKSSLYFAATGYVADQEGDSVIAIRNYKEATAIDPFNAQAWVWLAGVLLRSPEPDALSQASNALDKAATLLPRASIIPYQKGLIALKKGDPTAAISALQEALKLNPSSAEALFQLSLAQESAGKHQESQEARKKWETLSRYQREVNNLQIQIGRDSQNIALWRKLLTLAQKNGDQERVQQAQRRIATLTGTP
jgi:tetratricopeptide (TPR) repeat protein